MQKMFWAWVVLVVLLISLSPASVQGQGRPQTAILFEDPQPGEESLTLNVLFTVLDSTGQALPKDKVQFEGGGRAFGEAIAGAGVEATVVEATTPIRIALVIDVSGSMGHEIADVRVAALNFVGKTPANAEIAVFKFSDKAEPVEPAHRFVKRDQIGLVETAIKSLEYKEGGTTCIYKAASTAITAVSSGVSGNEAVRQAVVLFTDGINIEKDCGEIKEADVVKQAQQSAVIPVQVNTIGLCSPADCTAIEKEPLQSLAEKTNGAAFDGSLDQLDTLFDKILSVLNQQWMATAIVKPKKGQNPIAFTFKAKVNDLPADIPLNLELDSEIEYDPPLARIQIAHLYDGVKNDYTLKLTVTNPQEIKQLIWVLTDADGKEVLKREVPVTTISEELMIPFSGSLFKAGSSFTIEVMAIDSRGKPVMNNEGEAPVDTGKHVPAEKEPISFEFTGKPDIVWKDPVENSVLEIKLNKVQIDEGVTLVYEVFITEANEPVTAISKAFLRADSVIHVSIPKEKLDAILEAEQAPELTINLTLAEEGGPPTPVKQITTKPTRPPQSSWLQDVVKNLQKNPILTASIMLLVFLVAAIPFLASLRKRKPALAQPLYTGRTGLPETPIKRPQAEKKPPVVQTPKPPQPVPPVQRPVAGNLTKISESPAPPSLRINVVTTLDPSSNQGEEITRFPCVIGRENSAFIIAGDPEISRQHAEIVLQGNKLMIKDLKSSNGTFFVVRGPANTGGGFVEKLRLEKGGAAEWDTSSLLRLGPNTVLELKPQGALSAGGSHTVMPDDYANRTQTR